MSEAKEQLVTADVKNIGGITETTVEFSPGVTLLTGRNATNRTSLLQALMAAFGSENVSLKADSEEGVVELTIGDSSYTRTLRRQDGRITTDGEPYLEDTTTADLFAFLLETNDARQAVLHRDELRDVIMRPIDSDEIERQISRIQDEKSRIETEISEIDKQKQNLIELEEKRSELKKEISSKRDQLSEIYVFIDEKDESIESSREDKDELETRLGELSDVRSDLETIQHHIDSHQKSIDALEEERVDIETGFEDVAAIPEERIDEIDAELGRLRSERSDLDESLDRLQTVIQFNEDLLEDDTEFFTGHRDGDSESEVVTDQLLDEDNLVCWTCGNEITTDQIESMLARLRDSHTEKISRRRELDEEISELRSEQNELEELQRKRTRLESRLDDIEMELDDHYDRIEDLERRRHDLTDEIDQLEATIEELRTGEEENELIDLHREATRVESEIERFETDIEDVLDEIAEIEDWLDERDQLEAQRRELEEEIETLRTRVDRLERQAIDAFNDHMDTLLDVLDYENLDRIWLERTRLEERQGRQRIPKSRFELHIVRSTAEGTVYEDTIDHLSESEREVTGLVFALAGYLAHDIYEELPFILLDSVESIDAQRLADLIEYLSDYSDYLIAALLEEDAAALDETYQRITDI